MTNLTTHDEEKLLAATKRAADLVESGLTPNAAVEKVAREAKLGPGEIEMLCYAHNTGQQVAQFQKAANVLDKLAEYPLADPAAVVAAVYPARAEKAAADAAPARSLDYFLPPSWAEAARPAGLEKAALDLPPAPKAEAPPPDPAHAMRKRYGDYERAKQAHDHARQAVLLAEGELFAKLAAVTDYFRRPGRLPLAVVEKAAAAVHGPAAAALFDVVHGRLRSREKRAADAPDAVVRERVSLADPVFRHVGDAILAAERVAEKRAAAERARAEAEAKKEGLTGPFAGGRTGAADPGRPTMREKAAFGGLLGWGSEVGAIAAGDIIAHKATHDDPADAEARHLFDDTDAEIGQIRRRAAAAARPAAGVQKAAFLNSPAMGAFLGNSVGRIVGDGPKSKNELIEDEWLDLEDPKHLNEMRKIKAHALLNSVLTDPDSPISGHDPDAVLAAYNEISSLAPRVAEQPAAVKPILARKLQGNVQPFEAKEVTDIEKGIAATRNPTPNTSLLKDAPESLLG